MISHLDQAWVASSHELVALFWVSFTSKENHISHSFDKAQFPLTIGGDAVSELKVMRSAAGYYIGRSYFDTEFGFEGPYSRESGYMSEVDAKRQLAGNSFEVRDCIENNASYVADDGLPNPHA